MTKFSILIFSISFSGCGSGKHLEKEPPVAIDNPYYEKITRGVQVVIPVKEIPTVMLDSVYFGGNGAKLNVMEDNAKIYIGVFEQKIPDLIMSGDPKQEFGNQIPAELTKKAIPFKLEADECVIGYKKDEETKYFMISGLTEKTK